MNEIREDIVIGNDYDEEKEEIIPRLISKELAEQVVSWFLERMKQIDDNRIEEIWLTGMGDFSIETSYEDFCRGCHMGTIHQTTTITRDVFFSNKNIAEWKLEEKARKEEEKRIEEERISVEKSIALAKEKEEKARKKERRDLYEYRRLKAKYEGF